MDIDIGHSNSEGRKRVECPRQTNFVTLFSRLTFFGLLNWQPPLRAHDPWHVLRVPLGESLVTPGYEAGSLTGRINLEEVKT
jgi:hypothetical protein